MDFLRTLALAVSLLGGAALAQTKITLGYTAVPDFAAAFIAKERGFFEKRGLDVQLQLITLTSNVPPALVSNSVQIGGTTPAVFLQAADSGLDLVGLASGSLYDNTKNSIGVVVRSDAGIREARDLVGKKVGVPGLNGTLHVLVRRWLSMHGIDAKLVSFIEVSLPQMPDVLRGGGVDAVVTAEPFIGRMRAGGIGVPLQGFAPEMPNGFSTVVYTATRKWASSNGPAIQAFRHALADAVAYAQANRSEAYADLGKYFKVPPPVLQATPWPLLASDMTDGHLRFWVDTMREQDMLKKRPTVGSLIAK
ncbi:ABC transporter substrate-binding protein [Variovorax terrae]|uniref:ABC transporter substrate-binding protein n=1 Tax=Variovorax terrae TaxID=2923278 RepID=A0A9X2AP28_9BURK|nr:ABC transporter substrate-binding protein [Variovorax terrae]MCJ0761601.1 ABC transporter substrate-binding protein [Variovorax terrae]